MNTKVTLLTSELDHPNWKPSMTKTQILGLQRLGGPVWSPIFPGSRVTIGPVLLALYPFVIEHSLAPQNQQAPFHHMHSKGPVLST